MKIVADEGIERPIVLRLRSEGHQVIYIAESARGSVDPEILKFAKQEEALLITYDKDFGDLIFKQNYATYGVILLRLSDELSSLEKADIVVDFIDERQESLFFSFSVIKGNKKRTIMLLPKPGNLE